jgi:TatD DNase family protein
MVSDTGIEKAVFHWYSGLTEILDRILIDGYYISATPALAYSPSHQSAITKAPLERILIETDAPAEYRGEISEPANRVDTLRELSCIKNVPANELSQITMENAPRFFRI